MREGESVVITDAASTDVELWNTDPNKGLFGGSPASNGRVLEAKLNPAFPGQPNMEACWVEITVKSTDPERPLTGTVVFYLHPTYAPPTFDVSAINGEATLKLQAWGAFTLGAVVDGGSTRLELDWTTVAGGSRAFYET